MVVLFGHPFSIDTCKALVPLYETGTPFTLKMVDSAHPENEAELKGVWPPGTIPVLVEYGLVIVESSTIVEYIARGLVPPDRAIARETRMLDRVFDKHVTAVIDPIVAAGIEGRGDEAARAEAAATLDKVYRWLDTQLVGRTWAAGDCFTLADCAGAVSLFYADWVHPIAPEFTTLSDYRQRVLARPSVARCLEEARRHLHSLKLGAPINNSAVIGARFPTG